jgi:hypothetical protein
MTYYFNITRDFELLQKEAASGSSTLALPTEIPTTLRPSRRQSHVLRKNAQSETRDPASI